MSHLDPLTAHIGVSPQAHGLCARRPIRKEQTHTMRTPAHPSPFQTVVRGLHTHSWTDNNRLLDAGCAHRWRDPPLCFQSAYHMASILRTCLTVGVNIDATEMEDPDLYSTAWVKIPTHSLSCKTHHATHLQHSRGGCSSVGWGGVVLQPKGHWFDPRSAH